MLHLITWIQVFVLAWPDVHEHYDATAGGGEVDIAPRLHRRLTLRQEDGRWGVHDEGLTNEELAVLRGTIFGSQPCNRARDFLFPTIKEARNS